MGIILTGIYSRLRDAYDHSDAHRHGPHTAPTRHSADLFSILTLAAEALHLAGEEKGSGCG